MARKKQDQSQQRKSSRISLRGSFGFREEVCLRFKETVDMPYEKSAERYIKKYQIGPWDSLAREFQGVTLRPLFDAEKPSVIRKLISRAVKMDPTYKAGNLLGYYVLDTPPGTDLRALTNTLQKWESIDNCYITRPAPDPVVVATDDPRSTNQGYLDPAPEGIDARYSWGVVGGDGVGQRVIDMERGWTLDHEDLVAKGATLLHGVLLDSSRAHGTSVLGEICASDNTVGCVGIVPNIASVDVVSFNGSSRPNAILAAIMNLQFGNVLLLEAQAWVDSTFSLLGPIEVDDADFDAIRLATALGIVVVEAGGNGTNNGSTPPLNLDTYTNAAGLQILNPDSTNPDFRDSGAIIVSAATSTAPHTRLVYGPHGQRIDCYAWAQNIDTCHSDNSGATDLYRTTFGGTSGASPIVTGAVLALQGIAEASLGYRFSPRQMRAILRNPATGTPPDASETTQIGVMPNLRAIIDHVLNVTPDVYIRDNVGDTGDPHSGSISGSPDIILRPTPEANPQLSFGEGSGTEGSASLGFQAEAGQDNFLYARVRNRGGADATNVNVRIFWSPVSTMVTPDLWTAVGETTIPSVPSGNLLTVSDAIVWPKSEIPATGHYCFVGLIGNSLDPAPDPADFLDWNNFQRFIKDNNNVTWRNFNVVDNVPDSGVDDPVALDFLVPGAPDKTRRMRLEIVACLPKGGRAWLEMPFYMVDALHRRSPFLKLDKKAKGALVPLNPYGVNPFREILLPAKSRAKLKLHVFIPKEFKKNSYEVFVRQLYRKQEVGRVTWRLVPKIGKKRGVKE